MWLGYIVAMIMHKNPEKSEKLEPSSFMVEKIESYLVKFHRMGKFTSNTEATGITGIASGNQNAQHAQSNLNPFGGRPVNLGPQRNSG